MISICFRSERCFQYSFLKRKATSTSHIASKVEQSQTALKKSLNARTKMLIELSKQKNYIKTVHSSCYSFIYESVQHTHTSIQNIQN